MALSFYLHSCRYTCFHLSPPNYMFPLPIRYYLFPYLFHLFCTYTFLFKLLSGLSPLCITSTLDCFLWLILFSVQGGSVMCINLLCFTAVGICYRYTIVRCRVVLLVRYTVDPPTTYTQSCFLLFMFKVILARLSLCISLL